MSKKLSFKYIEANQISNQLLLEIWHLRIGLLELKKSEAEDWAYFNKWVKREDAAVLSFHDENDKVQGFFSVAYLPVEYENRKGLLMYSKYFYFNKAYRGHPKTMMAPWVLLPKAFRKYGLRRLYFVTTSFPQSFISLSRASGNVKTLKDDDISSWQKKALREFTLTFFEDDWNEEKGVIENQNIVDPPTLKMSKEAKALNDRYEKQNPEWRQGKTLPIIFAVDHVLVYHNFKRILRRLTR